MKKSVLFLFIAMTFLTCKMKQQEVVVGNSNSQTKQRPNMIFIMADDHATQAISAYGHPISKLAPTPNIDRIANDGAIFKNNFCTNSICGPSRAVVLTGKHSHVNGFRMNGDKFDGSQWASDDMSNWKFIKPQSWYFNGSNAPAAAVKDGKIIFLGPFRSWSSN